MCRSPPPDPASLADWAAENKIDLTVVGPESALACGIVDVFRERKLRIFGPTRAAAQLETSKAFAKAFMLRHDIPTAPYRVFSELPDVEQYLRQLPDDQYPVVVKADGLASGKGVTVAADRHVAIGAARLALQQPGAQPAPQVLIEDCLVGYEVSFMAISDGTTVVPLAPSRDYKRAFDGNTGPMTGGMGAYSPVSTVTAELSEEIMARVVRPTIEGMAAEGNPYQGVLYAGLMITRAGPHVLEFNARFGDPETQVVLPRLDTDLYIVLDAAVDGELGSLRPLVWARDAACGVVVASEGYPGDVETGYGIVGLGSTGQSSWIFHNGTRNPFVKAETLLAPKIERQSRGALGGRSLFGMLLPGRGDGAERGQAGGDDDARTREPGHHQRRARADAGLACPKPGRCAQGRVRSSRVRHVYRLLEPGGHRRRRRSAGHMSHAGRMMAVFAAAVLLTVLSSVASGGVVARKAEVPVVARPSRTPVSAARRPSTATPTAVRRSPTATATPPPPTPTGTPAVMQLPDGLPAAGPTAGTAAAGCAGSRHRVR